MKDEIKPEDTLTPREFEITQLLAGGLRCADIAKHLGISIETVKAMLWRARIKVGTDNSVGLAIWFVRRYPTAAKERAGRLRVGELTLERMRRSSRLGQATRNLRLGK